VVIQVNNPELKLKPGMTANVSIITAIKKNVLKIPNAALRFKPSEINKTDVKQKGSGVWVNEHGNIKRIPVSAGVSDGNYTELVSDQLKEGQEVIVETLTKTKVQSPKASAPRFF
jgi:HlyD family secretion protein